MSNMTLEMHGDKCAILTIDLPDTKVNILSSAVLIELKSVLESIKKRDDIVVLGIASAKEDVFIAGADISEIKDITEKDDAIKKAQFGQEVFDLLESLPCITVALINGACLGGGLELALACNRRIASDSPKCKLGLPEVSLGIIPGFGGTQRLPKLIGIQSSLDLIMGAKVIDCKKAYRLHLIDTFYKKEFFKEESLNYLTDLVTHPDAVNKRKIRKKSTGLLKRLIENSKPGQSILFKKAREMVLKKTHGHYPAPLAALDVMHKTVNVSQSKGLLIERTAFAELAISDISKNLIQVFFTSEALKKESGTTDEVQIKHINSAAVLGAGVMGGGIAWALSMRDISVRMKDISWPAIQLGFSSAAKAYAQLLKIRKMNKHQVANKMQHITGTLDYSGFTNRDIAIEAVVENMEIKKSVLKECEKELPANSILASNTSSLSISEMATALERPSNFVGMHFFNPVNRMPLVEVIAGTESSSSTIASIVALSKTLGKTPIVVKDCPGFLVNRILIPYLNEAILLWQEGASIEEVDAIIKNFGMPMGPFTLTDEVGIDIGYHVAKILEAGYGERMTIAAIFESLMAQEHLRGKKTGKGFYLYSKKEKKVNPEMLAIQKQVSTGATALSKATIHDRCMYAMINEAARCIEEEVVQNAAYLDMAMILGTGFPPFRGGPLRYADQIGIEMVYTTLCDLEDQYGMRFKPAEIIKQYATENRTFYP